MLSKAVNMSFRVLSFSDNACRILALSLLLLTPGCTQSTSPRPSSSSKIPQTEPSVERPSIRFTDVAVASGVSWTVRNGEEAGLFTILESFGGGCAIEDFDRDDRLDFFLAGGGYFGPDHEILPHPMALYRQISDWNFIPVTSTACLNPILHYNHGLWTADVDEDGFADLLITGWGGLQLFRNMGDGTFLDVSGSSGLTDSLWSLAAGWADLNRDDVLDLFVGHYVDWSFENDPICVDKRMGIRTVCDPSVFGGLPCVVYLGNGDGTFRPGCEELNIQGIGKTLGVVIADVNHDNQPDIYVANDTLPNQLYASQPTGCYREVGIETGVALGETGTSDGSMGVDFGDLTGDGKPDFWVANYENQTFALYRNLGNDMFSHASRAFGVTAVGSTAVGFGTIILDADGDGLLDIFCANGHIWAPNSTIAREQLPYLFQNDQCKRFRDIAPLAGDYMRSPHLGRGAAMGDLDANGTPDLIVTHTNEPVAVLRNDTPIKNWLSVHLIGRTSPRSGIGAKVIISTGSSRQTGYIKGGGSYLSTSSRTQLFGLGSATHVERIEVVWPTGRTSTLANVPSCQRIVVIEGVDGEGSQSGNSGN